MIVCGHGKSKYNKHLAEFIALRLGAKRLPWTDFTTIGRLNDQKEIMGAVVYYNMVERNIEAAAGGKYGWLSPELLWYMFYYPFMELALDRMTVQVRGDNRKSLNWCLNLGFQIEAILKGVYTATDLIIMALWKHDCRFLDVKRYSGTAQAT